MLIRLIVAKGKDSQFILIRNFILAIRYSLYHHDMNPLKASDFKFILLKTRTNNNSWILSLHSPQIGSEFIFKIMKLTATINFGVSLESRVLTTILRSEDNHFRKWIQIRSLLHFGMKSFFYEQKDNLNRRSILLTYIGKEWIKSVVLSKYLRSKYRYKVSEFIEKTVKLQIHTVSFAKQQNMQLRLLVFVILNSQIWISLDLSASSRTSRIKNLKSNAFSKLSQDSKSKINFFFVETIKTKYIIVIYYKVDVLQLLDYQFTKLKFGESQYN